MSDEDSAFIERVVGQLKRDYFDEHGVHPSRNARRLMRKKAGRVLAVAKTAKRIGGER